MTAGKLIQYYWDMKARTITRIENVQTGFAALHEKFLHDRMVRIRRLVSRGKKNPQIHKENKMKKFLGFFMVAFFLVVNAGVVCAQTVPSTDLFNFGELLHNLRAGYAVDQHGQKTTIFYAAVYDFHNAAKVSLVTLNIGYEGTLKKPSIFLGVRADNLIPMVWGGDWGKVHVTTAKLPTLEFGPWVSVWPKSNEDIWNLAVRVGVGGALGF